MGELTLESRIRAEVFNFSGMMGIYANDFKGNLIQMNAEEKFESASCIKLFILAELLRQIHLKKIGPDETLTYERKHHVVGSGVLKALGLGTRMTVMNAATLMIIVSDNVATNMIIDLLGVDGINGAIAELGYADTALHNSIDFATYERLGTTTPRDFGMMFERIHRRELWSPEISLRALAILKSQQYNTMLTKSLPPYYLDSEDTGAEEEISIASKSGSMDGCRNDGGLIMTPFGGYVLSIFTKDFKDTLYYPDHESNRFGGNVSRLMFDQFLALKGSFR